MSLRASYLLATSFAIVACSSVPAPQTHPPETSQISEANQSKLPRGVWEGDVSWNFFPDPEKVGLPSYHMIYRNCQDGPEILALLPDGQYASIATHFLVDSYEGTHVLRSFSQQRGTKLGWVESKVWNVFEIDEPRLVLAHSRSVNNRHSLPNDEIRYYISSGSGILLKSAEQCGPSASK